MSEGYVLRDAHAAASSGRRPVRVLHLRDSPWIDGPGRTILETAAHIDRSRVEYHIGAFVSDPDALHPLVERARQRGLNVHPIRDDGGAGSTMVNRISDLVRSLDVDVLHTSEFRSNVLGLLCRRQCNVILVSTVHGWIANDFKGRLYRWVDKTLLRAFDSVIFVSEATRRLVPAWWLPPARVHVLQNALVLSDYRMARRESSARPPDADIVILNVGRLSPEKGQDLLLSSFARLVPLYPSLRLKLAGIGPEEKRLRELANALGISRHVEFLGYMADMQSVYDRADLVVQSSLTEGMPNVILEAAYLGVPIVATDVGGTNEIVQHKHSAWLLPAGSVDALTEGMQAFLLQAHLFDAMRDRAHTRLVERFSFQSRTESLMAIYERLAGSGN